jgi:hypothetical protein
MSDSAVYRLVYDHNNEALHDALPDEKAWEYTCMLARVCEDPGGAGPEGPHPFSYVRPIHANGVRSTVLVDHREQSVTVLFIDS